MTIFSRALIFSGTILLSAGLNARDLAMADHYFAEQKYELALKEYISIADIGNPKAYYQLGVMHHNSYWVENSFLESLLWFSLAVEQDYEDSKQIVEGLFAEISAKQKEQVANIVADYLIKLGHVSVTNKFYPNLNEKHVSKKVFINDNNARFFDDLSFSADSIIAYSTLNQPYFLIIDYDIETDGSRRNLLSITSSDFIRDCLYNISSIGMSEPTFDEQPVPFIVRTYSIYG